LNQAGTETVRSQDNSASYPQWDEKCNESWSRGSGRALRLGLASHWSCVANSDVRRVVTVASLHRVQIFLLTYLCTLR